MIWESQKHVTSRLLELLFMEFVTVDEPIHLFTNPMTRALKFWDCFVTIHTVASGKASCFLERQSRVAREKVFIRPVADGANEIGFDACIGKEFGIHRLVAEAGHRTAVQSQRARRDNQVGALKTAVAKSGSLRG